VCGWRHLRMRWCFENNRPTETNFFSFTQCQCNLHLLLKPPRRTTFQLPHTLLCADPIESVHGLSIFTSCWYVIHGQGEILPCQLSISILITFFLNLMNSYCTFTFLKRTSLIYRLLCPLWSLALWRNAKLWNKLLSQVTTYSVDVVMGMLGSSFVYQESYASYS